MPSVSVGRLRVKIKPAGETWRIILPKQVDAWMEVAQVGFTRYSDALDCAKAWGAILQAKQERSAIQRIDVR